MTKLFKEFYNSEKSGGFVLIICTIISLVLANTIIGVQYTEMWHLKFAGLSLEHWVNDGLMAIFFLLIGLELERELYVGDLSSPRKAFLPIAAALGGMVFPAFIYILFNHNTPTASGFGIPIATDIAFALGVLSLLGKRVPLSLKVFLTALAVVDDLGAILIIAIFYTKTLIWTNLALAGGIGVVLLVLNKLKVFNLIPYIIGGIAMWYFMLHSGVHATITGVVLAFLIPFGKGNSKSPSYLLQHFLHKPVAFIVLPIFALANTAILLKTGWHHSIQDSYGMGISLGLFVGKPLGIFLFVYLAVLLGLSNLPQGLQWKHIVGVGFLAGIGFTMSIFITLLSFDNVDIINNAKLIILISSLMSGIVGVLLLKSISEPKKRID